MVWEDEAVRCFRGETFSGIGAFILGREIQTDRVATLLDFTIRAASVGGDGPPFIGKACVLREQPGGECSCRKQLPTNGSRLRPQAQLFMAVQNLQQHLLTVSWAECWQAG